MSRAERAKEYFIKGYACSQAVALAFSDLMRITEEDILRISLPFGGGLGRLRLTCGAVSGMALVIGSVFALDEQSVENKKAVYAIVQDVCAKFQAEMGSLICADLLTGAHIITTAGGEAEARTESYYKKRPCGDIVYTAAEILENCLKERGKL